jgi:AAA domain
MKIIKLTASNVKRLKAISFTPNGHINRISGANGSGKTSVLDAIVWALTGTSTVPSQPVRKDSGKAEIVIDLGDIVITRRFVEGGSRNGVLAIESKDGKTRYQGPQDMLDKLMGEISFDPLAFLRMHPSKQFEVLYKMVLPDVDPKTLNIQKHPDYLMRRDLKKEVTALETRRDAILIPDGLPLEKRDEAGLLRQLGEVGEYNARIEREKRQREDIAESVLIDTEAMHEKVRKIKALEDEIALLRTQIKEEGNVLARTQRIMEKWEPLPEPKNAAHYTEAITQAKAINAAIDKRLQRDELEGQIEELEKRITTLSKNLDAHEAANTKAIEEAHFPVEGLGFGDDEVLYNGFPFNQVSNADQIRASVAIGIAANPKLRVMQIKDGSLLDDASLKILAEMAWEKDVQMWIEQVDTSGKIGVYLEDGEVKAINEEPLDIQEPKAKPAKKVKAKKIPVTA